MPRLQLCLALLISTLVASGATDAWALRYASQSGSAGANCQTVATACSLSTAIGASVTAGEEIVVEPGNYSVGATINPTASNLHIHGVAGQPRPVITGAASTEVLHGNSINLAYLDIEGSGELLGISGGLFDRLFIRGNAGGNILCQCYDGTIRDSVIVVTGGVGGLGINSNGGNATEDLYNDTVISTAVGTPAIHLLQVGSNVPATIAYSAANVIARNLAGGPSVQSDQHSAGQSTVLTLHHSDMGTVGPSSNGASVVATDADITTAPLFANAALADFHELAGSPTIDKGIDNALNGPLDFDGATRAVGTTDIGAFEVQPPVILPIQPPSDPPADPPSDPPALTPGTTPPVTLALKPRLTITGRSFAVSPSTHKVAVHALCTAAAGTHCTVTGVLTIVQTSHGAKKTRKVTVGSLRGTLTAGRAGTLTLSLTHAGLVALRPTASGKPRRLTAALSATATSGKASRALDAAVSISLLRVPAKPHAIAH